jgi:hypothetical protein
MLSKLDSRLQILKKSPNIFPTFQIHALHYTPSSPSVLRAHGEQMICCIRLLLLANLSFEFEISVIRYDTLQGVFRVLGTERACKKALPLDVCVQPRGSRPRPSAGIV